MNALRSTFGRFYCLDFVVTKSAFPYINIPTELNLNYFRGSNIIIGSTYQFLEFVGKIISLGMPVIERQHYGWRHSRPQLLPPPTMLIKFLHICVHPKTFIPKIYLFRHAPYLVNKLYQFCNIKLLPHIPTILATIHHPPSTPPPLYHSSFIDIVLLVPSYLYLNNLLFVFSPRGLLESANKSLGDMRRTR